ncbi:GIY-YIG nuclease family protein [Candidatus Falkowbacteria bacterium]|nr:GIY-YIG nuclease family protein [Candidatus Falkowbacteria bacterium]
MKYYYVYIAQCSDKSYYIGVTNDLNRREAEHNSEFLLCRSYTYRKRPVKIIYWEEFVDINEAIRREKQIKRWSRKKKEALIKKNFEKLPKLSERKILNR